ncbi:MAG: response regulator, partial [Treponema sp.]|nr:response regulator [Treponema sp.]
MVEWGTETFIPDVRFVSLPIQSLSIANILNGKEDNRVFSKSSISSIIRHAFPGARILIVDDIQTNLKVTKGLLAPYRSTIDTCLSGQEAIELVKHNKYDLIFMDHMMPEMDGIEVTAIIRDLEKEDNQIINNNSKDEFDRVPIVALTANAVFGVREMFMEKNFDDFLAKPIDVTALDDIMCRWISKEKRENDVNLNKQIMNGSGFPEIEGINIQEGIRMTGGTHEGYCAVLSIFCKDALERMKLLPPEIDDKTLSLFVINIHAIKSAAASVGALEISSEAATLEKAGRDNDNTFINGNLYRFTEKLSGLIEKINIAIEAKELYNHNGVENNSEKLFPLLQKLIEELKQKKADNIDNVINEINKLPLDVKNKEYIEKISDSILMTEYENAVITIKEMFDSKL